MESRETTTKLKGKLLLNLGEKTSSDLSSNLKGKLIINQEIKKYEEYISNLKAVCSKNNYSCADLLGGNTPLSQKNSYRLSLSEKDKHNLPKVSNIPVRCGVAKYLDTGVNYDQLFYKNTKGRYKVYTSLLLDSEEKKIQARNYFMELFDYCYKNKLSIGYKTTDNQNYDSFILYTRDINNIETKIQELYSKYKFYGIFNSVPHFLQKPINGIDENHIGVVNEPLGGYKGDSHSGRMYKLGQLLDKGYDYTTACKKVGIKPDQPYNINRNDEEVIKNYKY